MASRSCSLGKTSYGLCTEEGLALRLVSLSILAAFPVENHLARVSRFARAKARPNGACKFALHGG
jgi:hypothetical protein